MTDPEEHDDMPQEEFDESDIDDLGEDISEDLDGDFDGVLDEESLDGDLDEEHDEEEESGKNGSARNATMSEDEDSDGEDRLAAGDDEDEDEETPDPSPEVAGQVAPKRDNEWTCEGCFLIVSSSQFGPRDNPRCPSGEEPCPSLARL